ncbi:MAG: hypothetical protein ACLGP3_08250 [Acidobacteriota bacterium]
MTLAKYGLLLLLAAGLPAPGICAARRKPHGVALGGFRTVPYSAEGDPAGALPGETQLSIRPLVVDGKVRDWTTGEAHYITQTTLVVRQAIRMNDSLPAEKKMHWVWQRGPWVLIDQSTGREKELKLPHFVSGISDAIWFRNYAAYCGLNSTGKELYAVVAELEVRRPLLAKKLETWKPEADAAPACAPAVWQRDPAKVTFAPAGSSPMIFDLTGTPVAVVRDDSGGQ